MPVAMVTGDDTVLEEARDLLGNIVTAQVKTAVSRYSAVFHPHEDTLKLLQVKALEACNKEHWMLFKPADPVVIEITFFDPSMADAAELIPQVHRVSARTIEILADGYPQAFRIMLAVGALGASRRDPYFS